MKDIETKKKTHDGVPIEIFRQYLWMNISNDKKAREKKAYLAVLTYPRPSLP
jgi:hypothetical protein